MEEKGFVRSRLWHKFWPVLKFDWRDWEETGGTSVRIGPNRTSSGHRSEQLPVQRTCSVLQLKHARFSKQCHCNLTKILTGKLSTVLTLPKRDWANFQYWNKAAAVNITVNMIVCTVLWLPHQYKSSLAWYVTFTGVKQRSFVLFSYKRSLLFKDMKERQQMESTQIFFWSRYRPEVAQSVPGS